MVKLENIFEKFPEPDLDRELTSVQHLTPDVKLEMVRSNLVGFGHERWYDQDEDEFVMLLRGSAELFVMEGERGEEVYMHPGDYLTIPAHVKHKVVRTSGDAHWIAIFYKAEQKKA